MKYILLYILTFIIFLLIDFLWLKFVATKLYSSKISHLMATKAKLLPALIFYIVYVVGIIILAVLPGYEATNICKTLIFGVLLGMISYSTYDLTNLSTLKNWPLSLSIIDIIWGTVVTTLASLSGYFIATLLNV